MQFSLILVTLFTAAFSGVTAGPIPQPVPELDTEKVALITRSLEARADQAQQANAVAQAHALAQLQQCRGGGCGGGWYGRGGGWPGRYSRAGGDFDLNLLGLVDLSASGGRTDYCTWPAC